MEFISGASREQVILLPDTVEDYVDEDNAVRVIEAYVNSLDMDELAFEKPKPNETGRPMYNPKDMLKLYIYGYMNRVRSSRRLEGEAKRNLEVIWLIRKLRPDHKTIARFRQANAKALKNVFRDFVKICMSMELYGKELCAIDGSKFRAVNSKKSNYTKRKLEERQERIEEKIKGYLEEMEAQDVREDGAAGGKTREEMAEIIEELTKRKQRYKGYAEELEQTGETQKSLTDPESRLMMANGKTDVCYNIQTVTDAKHKMIVAYEVTNNASDDNQITPMTEQAKEILEVESITVVTDVGYDSVQDIVKAMSDGAQVHVAGTDYDICVLGEDEGEEIREHKNGRPVYYGERNIALCPMGHVLYPGYYKEKMGQGVFYNSKACKGCTNRCTKQARRRDYCVRMAASEFTKTYDDKGIKVKQVRIKADKEIVKQRKSIVEHPFGTIKRGMDAGYCLLKGKRKVRGEMSLTFLAYNLKRAINIKGVTKLIQAIKA